MAEPVSIALPAALARLLEAEAERQGVSRDQLAARLLTAHLLTLGRRDDPAAEAAAMNALHDAIGADRGGRRD